MTNRMVKKESLQRKKVEASKNPPTKMAMVFTSTRTSIIRSFVKKDWMAFCFPM